jgi:DNA polymerase III subunit epsilon
MNANSDENLEAMARTLEESGQYRVLRRIRPRTTIDTNVGDTPTRLGLVIDVETTGLDANADEIIELAMVPFTYTLDGRILEIHAPFEGLREPSVPIPSKVTALTGLDHAKVAGHRIDPLDVAAFAAPATLIVAHNAAFDRLFSERFCDVFATKAWACSMCQIAWADEGFEGTKLSYLASGFGLFYDGHRGINDCIATLEILARPLPRCGETGLSKLLAEARASTWRIWAVGAPYDVKNVLKDRGYRWNPEGKMAPKAWYIDVSEANRDAEVAYIHDILQSPTKLPMRKISAYERFSERA